MMETARPIPAKAEPARSSLFLSARLCLNNFTPRRVNKVMPITFPNNLAAIIELPREEESSKPSVIVEVVITSIKNEICNCEIV